MSLVIWSAVFTCCSVAHYKFSCPSGQYKNQLRCVKIPLAANIAATSLHSHNDALLFFNNGSLDMLILHQSNRLEYLAQSLASLLRTLPLQDLFTPETIVIQSQGMRRYINRYLAQHNGIAANIDFSLPARLMWQLMQDNLAGLSKLSPFSSNVLQWRLMNLFEDAAFSEQQGAAAEYLASYLDSRDEAYFDLAFILADIFDQYLIYRADWIENWQQQHLLGLGDDEAWQADLWQQLTEQESHQGDHRLKLWQRLQDALPNAKLPERIWVFGITSMAPMYLELFRTLSKYTDVHIFAMNPSQEYWGNIIEPETLLRKYSHMAAEEVTEHNGHPLLASLGKQGRDFFDALTSDIEYEYNIELFRENTSNTLLARLQNDLLYLKPPVNPEPEHAGLQHPQLQDGSIVINSAHSALRELQILKDQIISTLESHPDWGLHDIAVLTPKIDPYLPFLEAVFGQHCPDGHPLAYSVADVKLNRQQPLLQAIDQFLQLMDSRFELADVLPLLDAPALQQRFGWDSDDVAVLHTTVRDLNIRWGLDEAMRREFGGDGDAFTWQQGLERVVMGWMLPQSSAHIAWHSSVPYASEPTHWALLAAFWQLVHQLQTWHQSWQQAANVATWIQRLQDAIEALFAPLDSDVFALQQWQQNLLSWQQHTDLANYQGELSFALVKRHVSAFLQQESQAGFLRGGITVCSMVPMRGLPFKMLCLIGMNDGEFPRDTKAPSFDLIYQDSLHHRARKGDRSRRDDDRYLFLECLLNAREQLYVSYVGKDIKKDDALAASTVVYEFIDTIAAMTGASSKDLLEGIHTDGLSLPAWVKTHPLQAFSNHYFQEHAPYTSYRQDLAQALSAKPKTTEAFVDAAYLSGLQDDNQTYTSADLSMEEWLRFWHNPTRQWLHQRLNWSPTYGANPWPEHEPFELEKQPAGTVFDAYYEARRQHASLQDTFINVSNANLLPMGEFAPLLAEEVAQHVLPLPSAWFEAQVLSPLDTELHHSFEDGSQVRLRISLRHRTDIGQLFWFNHQPNFPEKMQLWLEHLAFCACDDSKTPKTTIVAWAKTPWQLRPVAPDLARDLLIRSLRLWQLGQKQPLPFFARTSLQTADAWWQNKVEGETDVPTKAKQQAYTQYHGNKVQFAQADESEVALVFGYSSDTPIDSPLFYHIIEQICLPMYEHISSLNEEGADDAA